jgi:hypothetical protein
MTRYTLTIEADARPDDPEAVRALRAALKRMLRGYGWRCVTVRPVEPTPQDAKRER